VLPHEFSLKHLHGFLAALPWPRLIFSCLASASSMLPRPQSRENCLTKITEDSQLIGADVLAPTNDWNQHLNFLRDVIIGNIPGANDNWDRNEVRVQHKPNRLMI